MDINTIVSAIFAFALNSYLDLVSAAVSCWIKKKLKFTPTIYVGLFIVLYILIYILDQYLGLNFGENNNLNDDAKFVVNFLRFVSNQIFSIAVLSTEKIKNVINKIPKKIKPVTELLTVAFVSKILNAVSMMLIATICICLVLYFIPILKNLFKRNGGTQSPEYNRTRSTQYNQTYFEQYFKQSTQYHGTRSTQYNRTQSTQYNRTRSTQYNGTRSTQYDGTQSTQYNRTRSTQYNGTQSTQYDRTPSTQYNRT
eukprot:301839_1